MEKNENEKEKNALHTKTTSKKYRNVNWNKRFL